MSDPLTRTPVAPVEWVGINWGVSSAQAFAFGENQIPCARSTGPGTTELPPADFEAAIFNMIAGWIDAPLDVFIFGLVGVGENWPEPPRRTVPCKLGEYPRFALLPTGCDRSTIKLMPGLRQTSPSTDIIDAEEISLLGFTRKHPEFNGLVCVTGFHSKWATVGNEYILKFETVMTEELFDIISSATALRHSTAEGWDEGAFLDGVAQGADAPDRLNTRIFSIRAADLMAGSRVGEGRSRLLGMMIGAELSPRLPFARPVGLIGDGHLAECYALAIEALGRETIRMGTEDAIITGLAAARSNMAAATA